MHVQLALRQVLYEYMYATVYFYQITKYEFEKVGNEHVTFYYEFDIRPWIMC